MKPIIDQGETAVARKSRVAERVLVVDDSKVQRRILQSILVRWGFEVFSAASGAEALALCQDNIFDVVISDWMMPEMDGLAFCREFRALSDRPYGYFILLTSKSEKPEIARGLDVGADDFVSKPVSSSELLARIHAGERILEMERELREKNRIVSETLDEMSALYRALDNDLADAKRLQQSLVRERFRDFGTTQISLLLRPSGHVGGDLVGYFRINESEVGVFALDVSGHGVASAMLTARLAGLLNSPSVEQNLALTEDGDGIVRMLPPAKVAQRLNDYYHTEIEADQYFTMILGKIELATGRINLVQCGHPNPLMQNIEGNVTFHGPGGLPIGLMEGADWEEFEITIPKGGRLLLASDGMTECPDAEGNLLDDDGLANLMSKNADLAGSELLEALVWDMTAHARDKDLPDDVSGVLLEYSG